MHKIAQVQKDQPVGKAVNVSSEDESRAGRAWKLHGDAPQMSAWIKAYPDEIPCQGCADRLLDFDKEYWFRQEWVCNIRERDLRTK